MATQCQAYKCTTQAEPDRLFCSRCNRGLTEDQRRDIRRAIAQHGRDSSDTMRLLIAARIGIARYQNYPEIEIEQFMFHDRRVLKRILREEIAQAKKRFERGGAATRTR